MDMELSAIWKWVYYRHLLEKRGIFSKKVTINYKAESHDPWLNLDHPTSKDLSFRIHNLEFGKERQGEAAFLHMAAQRGKNFRFNGFVNYLYLLGFARVRGYLEVPDDNYKLGIIVTNGRVSELITRKEIDEVPFMLMHAIYLMGRRIRGRKTLADKV